jgi:two-component system, OmpR family, KDP operon response regulator KdpE
LLRGARPTEDGREVIRCGNLVIDLATRSVTRDGEKVCLSATEFAVLARLVRHPGLVVDRQTLLHEAWGLSERGEQDFLRMFMQRLRSKLEDDPDHPEVIVREGTRGYRLGHPHVSD